MTGFGKGKKNGKKGYENVVFGQNVLVIKYLNDDPPTYQHWSLTVTSADTLTLKQNNGKVRTDYVSGFVRVYMHPCLCLHL